MPARLNLDERPQPRVHFACFWCWPCGGWEGAAEPADRKSSNFPHVCDTVRRFASRMTSVRLAMRRCPKCNSFFDDLSELCVYDGAVLSDVQIDSVQDTGLAGARINDRYDVKEAIGEGGMGMVYKAIDGRSGEEIAIKVLHREISDDERTVRRFFSEARVLSSLTHPNIIRFTDFGRTEDGQLYIAMELLTGSPADELIENRSLSLKAAIEVIDQTAAALAEAHLQGVIHRDLKPANLFVADKENGSVHVTVLDFGIAKIAGSGQNLTATGKVMGTPSYMAPEQIRGGEPDPRTDVYALGALGYELISGKPPFLADGPIAVLFMHLEREPIPLDQIDTKEPVGAELAAAVNRLLAKKPEERPANMLEVRRLLDPFLGREHNVVQVGLGDTDVFTPEEAIETQRFELPDPEATTALPLIVKGPPRTTEPRPPDLPATVKIPLSRPPRPPRKQEGAPISWYLGAVLIAILLAGILAMGAFLVWSSASGGLGKPDRPGVTAPKIQEEQ